MSKHRKEHIFSKKWFMTILIAFLCLIITINAQKAQACSHCGPCEGICKPQIEAVHDNIREHIRAELERHREWLVDVYFIENITPAMMLMAEQLTTIGMLQVQVIGTFFDAKHQLETQRLFQTLVARAHKDYHPSAELCEIGTSTRSLASSERRSNLNQFAFANRSMARQLLSEHVLSATGEISDRESRLLQFRTTFCDPADNADGLGLLCEGGGPKERRNMDVDYTSAVENKLTLDLDFIGPQGVPPSADEENVFAMNANLFGHRVLAEVADRLLSDQNANPRKLASFYMKQRSIAAKRSVAQNSFAAVTSLRSSSNGENSPFLKAIIAELGVPEEFTIPGGPTMKPIDDYLGENPSYFAQMEVLTKKMYQSPKFYSDLYDKPVNTERKGVALQAIGIMQDRDIYKSLLRSEAVLATLLETLIQREHERISRDLSLPDATDGERLNR